jgi:phosphate:Na+ symporter
MFWQLFAGLALFMISIQGLENALMLSTGNQLKNWLKGLNQHPFYAVLGGTLTATILQSSSVVNLMILSFVGAGILGMKNGIYLMMGANLGSTVSSWLVALIGFSVGVESYAYGILSLSLLVVLFGHPESKIFEITQVFIHFALILIGLTWLRHGGEQLISQFNLQDLKHLGQISFMLIGFLMTAIVQSASPTIAIALTALYHQSISFPQTAAVILGAELGSALKYVLASWGGIPIKKQVAYANFLFNIVTLIVGIFVIQLFESLWFSEILRNIGIGNDLMKVPVFQSSINILSILVFWPLIQKVSTVLEHRFPSSATQITAYLQLAQQNQPDSYLSLAILETQHLNAAIVHQIKSVLGISTKTQKQDLSWQNHLKQLWQGNDEFKIQYEHCKQLQAGILAFLSPQQFGKASTSAEVMGLIDANQNLLKALKNIKDVRHNLAYLDTLHEDEMLYPLWQETKVFLRDLLVALEGISQGKEHPNPSESIKKLLDENHQFFQAKIQQNIELLQNQNLEHIQGATQLNVLRELQSAMKALIKSQSLDLI